MPLPPDSMPAPLGAPTDPAAPEAERWRITDDRAAEWVMRRYAAAAHRLGELDAELAEYRTELERWWRDSGSGERATVQWAEHLLERYATEVREADPERRTLRLPSGSVATRQQPARVTVHDAGAVAASLAKARLPEDAYNAVVSTRVQVSTSELAKVVQLADEWELRLACGCAPVVWQLGESLPLQEGDPWPWRDGDHRQGCPRNDDKADAKVVDLVQRRNDAVVAVVPDGAVRRVYVVDGASAAPAHLSVTVRPS